jgi:outer membrane protein assembly factor BamB
MGDRQGKDHVFALGADSGKALWETPVGRSGDDGPRCTPTVDGDRVYALTREGDLVCLAVGDGHVLWRKNYAKDFHGRMMSGWGYSESPLVDGDKLVCTPGGDDATVVALDKHTGAVLWKAAVRDGGWSGYASLVIAEVGGVRQYITVLGRCFVGVAATDGRLLWRYGKAVNSTANIPTPVVWGDLVFCTTAYGAGSALLKLVPENGGIKVHEQYFLRGNVLQNHHGGVVRVGEYLYGGHGHNEGFPFCLKLKEGKFAWGPLRGPGEGSAAVVYADGNLYFRYENGLMALIAATPEGYHLRSTFALPSYTGTPSWAHPVIAHGKLYIRGNDVLLCYDVKQH